MIPLKPYLNWWVSQKVTLFTGLQHVKRFSRFNYGYQEHAIIAENLTTQKYACYSTKKVKQIKEEKLSSADEIDRHPETVPTIKFLS